VMDETSCMVDVARFFLEFCKSESCGKCVPCRAGTEQMYRMVEKIAAREATAADLEIRWPSGRVEEVRSVAADQLAVIREGAGVVRTERFRGRAPDR